LGTIWIDCPNESLSRGLERALGALAADVRRGKPKFSAEAPSAVVCYADGPAEAARRVQSLKASVPDASVLVLSPRVDAALARAALGSGAEGALPVGMPPGQIVRALAVAMEGEAVFPRELLEELVEGDRPPDLSVLRPRQLEILALVAEGLTNAEIARRLFLSLSTVKQHLRGAFKAVGVKNRREAATATRQIIRRGS